MPLILGTNSIKDTGFNVPNSLRFQANDYLKIDPSGDGNLKTWTTSFWVKRQIGSNQTMWDAGTNGGNNYSPFFFQADGTLRFYEVVGGTLQSFNFITNRVFRDNSAWYHFVYRVDTTQGTDTNRIRLYVNGVQETSFSTAAYPAEDYSTLKNDATFEMIIGSASDNKGNDMQGYMSEFVHIDGQSLAPTSFGEFDEDSGIWKPIDVSGLTFGTNGFYLQFKETGTSQNSSGIGADTSGQDNHMAVSGLAAIDQSTDTCTNNFATMNPLDNFIFSGTFSEGNLKVQTDNSSYASGTGTIGLSTGKWYWEIEYDAKSSGSTDYSLIGILGRQVTADDKAVGDETFGYAYYSENGEVRTNNANVANWSEVTYTTGDIVGVALDLDNSKLYFSKNGTFIDSGDPTSGSTGTGAVSITAAASTPLGVYFPAVSYYDGSTNGTFICNFGSPPVAISSGNTDGNGFGNFEYAVPSGYFALCTKNLAENG